MLQKHFLTKYKIRITIFFTVSIIIISIFIEYLTRVFYQLFRLFGLE